MTEKKSFIVYKSYRRILEKLTMEERGELFMALFDYAIDGNEPTLSPKAEIAFAAIQDNMDRDLEKYEETCKKRAEAGKKGGRPKKQTKANESNWFFEKAKKPDNDNDNDNENDNDYENDNENENDNVYDNENEPSARRSRKSEAFGDIEKAKNILSYLNEKTDSNFSAENENTLRHINARFKEGFKEEHFITVIDKKIAEWQGTEYEKYLRPSTLFGSKFEDYLYQKKTIKRDYYVAPGEDDILPF